MSPAVHFNQSLRSSRSAAARARWLTAAVLSLLLPNAPTVQACAEHAGGVHAAPLSPPDAWWSWDPFSLAILACSALIYATGLTRLWRNAGFGHGIRRFEAAAFVAGWSALALALLSPLDALSDVLFWAHMTQHELLMLVAAPAMVVGRPFISFCWALPDRIRFALLQRGRDAAQSRPLRLLTAPLSVLAIHALALWLWHIPALFNAALRDERIHALQHASFFFSAALFFFAVTHGRYGRVGYGASTLFVFLTAAHSGLLGALLTLANQLWYPMQSSAGLTYGICPLEDQQLAGLIMWIPAGALLTVFALALFAAWLGESERRASRARRLRAEHG
jgi:putative membrane protein